MKKALIKPRGYGGDHLFASSAVRQLKEEKQFDVVDMSCGLKQLEPLLNNNPYVDYVFTTSEFTPTPLHGISFGLAMDEGDYDKEFELRETTKDIAPPLQAQLECGVHNPNTRFEVFTNPEIDEQVKEKCGDEPYIACMQPCSWREKAYGFTLEEYMRGIDVPNKGYGGRLRDIDHIVVKLLQQFKLFEVGMTPSYRSSIISKDYAKFRSLEWDASVIKGAEFFIGAEGGLANVAAGVRTKSILTGEFVHQLYGHNGVIKKIENPQLGPRFYYPDDGHIDLNPYLTDDEVIQEMTEIMNGNKTAKDYTYEWTKKI